MTNAELITVILIFNLIGAHGLKNSELLKERQWYVCKTCVRHCDMVAAKMFPASKRSRLSQPEGTRSDRCTVSLVERSESSTPSPLQLYRYAAQPLNNSVVSNTSNDRESLTTIGHNRRNLLGD